jgi:hypothetical protein
MEQHEITHVQAAVRGLKATVAVEIEQTKDGQYAVRCPYQYVSTQETRTRYKACFDVEIYKQCLLYGRCLTKEPPDRITGMVVEK